jgi:hypothetical protein
LDLSHWVKAKFSISGSNAFESQADFP